MLGFMAVMFALLVALAEAVGSEGRVLIGQTPYNNPYSDATGARDDRFA